MRFMKGNMRPDAPLPDSERARILAVACEELGMVPTPLWDVVFVGSEMIVGGTVVQAPRFHTLVILQHVFFGRDLVRIVTIPKVQDYGNCYVRPPTPKNEDPMLVTLNFLRAQAVEKSLTFKMDTYTSQHAVAIDHGYPSWTALLDSMQRDGTIPNPHKVAATIGNSSDPRHKV